MKKLILLATLVAASAFAQGSRHGHSWQKISDQIDSTGYHLCQWRCNQGDKPHYTTTSGASGCSIPY